MASTVAASTVTAHNPTGFPPDVSAKELAPSLPSLDGRRVALVDARFDYSRELMAEVKAWFDANLPSVETVPVEWRGPFEDDPETARRLREIADAAIVGVGQCSTCSPAVARHTLAIDAGEGVPTVGIHGHVFARLVESVASVNGAPELRRVFYRQPLVGRTQEQIRELVHGDDAITGRPFMQEILEALTVPRVRATDASFRRETPRLEAPASEDELQERFRRNGWTDQLPIVIPTEERVEAMLRGTSRAPDDVVGHLSPTLHREKWQATVEKVAVNAVMAGARPEYLPVILALASSGMSARHSSTLSMTAFGVVNGPIRDEIGMSSGTGAMGPYNHVNATIGRAWGLLSQNIQGGSEPGVTYMGSQGNPEGFASIVFAENEEASPWEPYHVQQGRDASDSTVTPFLSGFSTIYHYGVRDTWEANVTTLLRAMDPSLPIMFVLDPLTARKFVERGIETKDDLVAWTVEHAQMRADEWRDRHEMQNWYRWCAAVGDPRWAGRFDAPADEVVPMFTPDWVRVTVVGGETAPTWRLVHADPEGIAPVSIDAWR